MRGHGTDTEDTINVGEASGSACDADRLLVRVLRPAERPASAATLAPVLLGMLVGMYLVDARIQVLNDPVPYNLSDAAAV